jgi:ribose transport system substrate-binding protein
MTKIARPVHRLLLLVLSILLLAGCGRDEQIAPSGGARAPAAKAKGTIGLSVLTLTNPFFKEIADSMTREAARHGYEVVVVSGEFDVAKQQNQVKDFIVRKVSAIVLTPCDSKAIGAAVTEANAAGIPVFTADIACLAPGVKVVSHVATDNYSGGKQAAQAMIEALGGRGKVAILDHPEVESVLLRTKGFLEVLAEENKKPEVEIQVVARIPGGGVKDKSFKAAEDLIQAHSDLNGIFAINDPSALGAHAALEKAGRAGQVKIIGFDGQTEGKQAIKAGKIYADPIQFPDRIGLETVRLILRHFNGEEVPAEFLIPTALYRKADAEKDAALN